MIVSLTKYIQILFWVIVAILFGFGAVHYKGSFSYYLFFTISFNLYLFLGLNKKRVFFDFFFSSFLWLGFWLKLTVRSIISDGQFNEATGYFDFSAGQYDQTILIAGIAVSGLICATLIRQRFGFSYKFELPKNSEVYSTFYQRYRTGILLAFLILILLTGFINVYFGIYQRGLTAKTVLPFGLNGVIKWLVLFGLSSFSALIIHFEILSKKVTSLSLSLAIFETFISNTSLLSRGMILNFSGLFYGIFQSFKQRITSLSIKNFLVSIFVFVSLFILSVGSVQIIRSYFFTNTNLAPSTAMVKARLKSSGYDATRILFIDRWVGIESLAAVVSYPQKGWDLWKIGWNEKYQDKGTSYFDININKSNYNNLSYIEDVHFISIPGSIAFFFYPGSKTFLFFSMFLVGLIGVFFEIAAYKISFDNLVLSSLIAQVVAYRFAHFGYVPRQSYLLFGSIILTFGIISVLLFLIRKLSYNSKSSSEYSNSSL